MCCLTRILHFLTDCRMVFRVPFSHYFNNVMQRERSEMPSPMCTAVVEGVDEFTDE